MRDWDGLKPTPLLLPDLASHDMYTKADVHQLEDYIACFTHRLSITYLAMLQLSYLTSIIITIYFVEYFYL
jgi:hypothetical protein